MGGGSSGVTSKAGDWRFRCTSVFFSLRFVFGGSGCTCILPSTRFTVDSGTVLVMYGRLPVYTPGPASFRVPGSFRKRLRIFSSENPVSSANCLIV